MVKFNSFLVALMAVADSLAAPSELAPRNTIVTTSTTGTAGGYYYSCYIESGSGVSMNIGTGSYTLTWTSTAEDVVAGIGWATGAVR
jgi:endo-1,4-beta-xylanase